jgi:hypothetical protein
MGPRQPSLNWPRRRVVATLRCREHRRGSTHSKLGLLRTSFCVFQVTIRHMNTNYAHWGCSQQFFNHFGSDDALLATVADMTSARMHIATVRGSWSRARHKPCNFMSCMTMSITICSRACSDVAYPVVGPLFRRRMHIWDSAGAALGGADL